MSESSLNKLKIILVMAYMAVSHILLPRFNEGNDWYIFSRWDFFEEKKRDAVVDFHWTDEKGERYFFRDYAMNQSRPNFNFTVLFNRAQSDTFIVEENAKYIDELRRFCSCHDLSIVKLRGSMAAHLLFHQELPLLETVPL